MNDVLVLIVAAGFALMGLGALARPREVLAQFGVAVDTADGRNEVRAVYGGFGLAVAALLAVAVLGDPSTSEGILVTVAVALAGMAGGRLVSAALERPRSAYPVWVFFAIEVAGAAALLAAMSGFGGRADPRRPQPRAARRPPAGQSRPPTRAPRRTAWPWPASRSARR